jgi:phospholipid/cholesterol/gamma-HCH transport system substrate-binding protein
MDERRMQFRVGAIVLATLMIGGLLVALIGPAPQSWVPWAKGKYRVTIDLDQAPGIAPNTPVRKNGILIGRVSSIEDLDDRVLVTASIDEDVKLYPQYQCQVRTSVLGDSTIDFVARSVPPGTPPLTDGAVVEGTVLGNPLDMITNLQGDLSVMIDSLGRAGNEIATLANTVNQVLGEGDAQQRFVELMDRAIVALDSFGETMNSVEGLFADEDLRESLRQSLTELPAALRDARQTMRSADEMFQGVDEMIQGMDAAVSSAERNFRNLEGFTGPLGENGQDIVNSMVATVEGIDRMMEEITVITNRFSTSEGSLRRFLDDRELYDDVMTLSRNANALIYRLNVLTAQISPDVRKTVHDASIFTDKIAREPSRVISGALNRGPNIK